MGSIKLVLDNGLQNSEYTVYFFQVFCENFLLQPNSLKTKNDHLQCEDKDCCRHDRTCTKEWHNTKKWHCQCCDFNNK